MFRDERIWSLFLKMLSINSHLFSTINSAACCWHRVNNSYGTSSAFLQGPCLLLVSDWSCESLLSRRCVTLCFFKSNNGPESLPTRTGRAPLCAQQNPRVQLHSLCAPLATFQPSTTESSLFALAQRGGQPMFPSLLSLPATKCALLSSAQEELVTSQSQRKEFAAPTFKGNIITSKTRKLLDDGPRWGAVSCVVGEDLFGLRKPSETKT